MAMYPLPVPGGTFLKRHPQGQLDRQLFFPMDACEPSRQRPTGAHRQLSPQALHVSHPVPHPTDCPKVLDVPGDLRRIGARDQAQQKCAHHEAPVGALEYNRVGKQSTTTKGTAPRQGTAPRVWIKTQCSDLQNRPAEFRTQYSHFRLRYSDFMSPSLETGVGLKFPRLNGRAFYTAPLLP
jgi:hypothetical protein